MVLIAPIVNGILIVSLEKFLPISPSPALTLLVWGKFIVET